nr:endo-beta-1,6-glucanase - fungus (Trichoderma harzianum) [Trichoderma harzianum]
FEPALASGITKIRGVFQNHYRWLSWMTNRIHTNPAYSTVGMIEVLNEPV